jgi:hypothetical protein
MTIRFALITYVITTAVALASGAKMKRLAAPLHPRILDLELAGTEKSASLLLDDWKAEGRKLATKIVWLDYVFLFAYGVAGPSLCYLLQLLSQYFGWLEVARLAPFAGWLFVATAAFDALENLGVLTMIHSINRSRYWRWPRLTAICSIAKFTSVLLAVQFLIVLIVRGWIWVIVYLTLRVVGPFLRI